MCIFSAKNVSFSLLVFNRLVYIKVFFSLLYNGQAKLIIAFSSGKV